MNSGSDFGSKAPQRVLLSWRAWGAFVAKPQRQAGWGGGGGGGGGHQSGSYVGIAL